MHWNMNFSFLSKRSAYTLTYRGVSSPLFTMVPRILRPPHPFFTTLVSETTNCSALLRCSEGVGGENETLRPDWVESQLAPPIARSATTPAAPIAKPAP